MNPAGRTRPARLGLAGALVLATGATASAAASAPTTASRVSPVNQCWVRDTNPPLLTGVSVSPATVDTTDGPATVAVTLDARDRGGPASTSGLAPGRVLFKGPGSQSPLVSVDVEPADAGHLVGQLTLPRFFPAGRYTTEGFEVLDRAGNSGSSIFDISADQQGPSASFEVTDTGIDDTAPVIQQVTLTPDSVDTTSGPQEVTVTAVVTDAGAGVDTVRTNPGIQGVTSFGLVPTGTPDTYRGTFTVPPFFSSSDVTITTSAEDKVGNVGSRAAHLVVVGQTIHDQQKPRLVWIKRAPARVDLRHGDASMTVTAHLTDNAGIRRVTSSVDALGLGYDLPLGFKTTLKRVSGTARNGVWRGQVRIDDCAPIASKKLRIRLSSDDVANNRLRVYPAATVGIQHLDRVRPFVHIVRPHSIPVHGPLVLKFQNDKYDSHPIPVRVQDISTRTVGVFTYSVLGNRFFDYRPVDGSWRCFSSPTGGARTRTPCSGDRIRRAEFRPTRTIPDHLRVDFRVPGWPQVTDRAGNPAYGGKQFGRR